MYVCKTYNVCYEPTSIWYATERYKKLLIKKELSSLYNWLRWKMGKWVRADSTLITDYMQTLIHANIDTYIQ
jgi:hypothetical protein